MHILLLDKGHAILMEKLSQAGYICHYEPHLTIHEVMAILPNYVAVVVRSKMVFTQEVIDCGTQLQCIARIGAGVEIIDVEYAQSKGIAVLNSPEGNRQAVAEHTIGMLLQLFNHLKRADTQVRQGIWLREENRGMEICGKTLGIIGYGHMGAALAKCMNGFGATIIAYDKYKTNYSDAYAQECSLEELFTHADIISLHVPLTTETTYLVDDAFISSCKKNIYLINTSRGKVVKTDDLVKHLKTGKIAGAALDVLEYESATLDIKTNELPDAFHYLASAEQVILSPHVAGWTLESKFKLSDVLADKIIAHLNLSIR